MTEEIGSGSQKRPSQPEIKIALLEERLREAAKRDSIIAGQLAMMVSTLSRMETSLALGEQRMNQIDEHLKSTDTDLTTLKTSVESDKRGPVALILGTISGLGTAATAIWMAIKSG